MALKERSFPDRKIIHHSDRGIHYCSPEFERYTLKNDTILSTTQNSDPYENAVAERMNKTLKYEYGLKETLPDLKTAQKMTQQAVTSTTTIDCTFHSIFKPLQKYTSKKMQNINPTNEKKS